MVVIISNKKYGVKPFYHFDEQNMPKTNLPKWIIKHYNFVIIDNYIYYSNNMTLEEIKNIGICVGNSSLELYKRADLIIIGDAICGAYKIVKNRYGEMGEIRDYEKGILIDGKNAFYDELNGDFLNGLGFHYQFGEDETPHYYNKQFNISIVIYKCTVTVRQESELGEIKLVENLRNDKKVFKEFMKKIADNRIVMLNNSIEKTKKYIEDLNI